MPITRRSRRFSRLLVAVLAVAGLLLAGCGVTTDPEDELADAFEDSVDGSFAYGLTVEADRAALDALGDGAADAASFLERFGISGAVDEDRAASLSLSIGGGVPLFEARTFGDELYLNLGINDFLGLGGGSNSFDPRDELAPALGALGFSEEVQTAVIDALDGRWIAVEGGLDLRALQQAAGGDLPAIDGESAAVALTDALGEDLDDFFDEFVVVESVDEEGDDIRRYAVELRLRELLRALGEMNEDAGVDGQPPLEELEADLADLPEVVPGTVITDQGIVTEVRLDLAAPDGDSGSVLLVLVLSDVDAVAALEEPADAARLSQAEFLEVVQTLSGLTGALPSGAAS